MHARALVCHTSQTRRIYHWYRNLDRLVRFNRPVYV